MRMFGRIETLAPDQTSLLARLTYEGITVRKRAATAPIMRRKPTGIQSSPSSFFIVFESPFELVSLRERVTSSFSDVFSSRAGEACADRQKSGPLSSERSTV